MWGYTQLGPLNKILMPSKLKCVHWHYQNSIISKVSCLWFFAILASHDNILTYKFLISLANVRTIHPVDIFHSKAQTSTLYSDSKEKAKAVYHFIPIHSIVVEIFSDISGPKWWTNYHRHILSYILPLFCNLIENWNSFLESNQCTTQKPNW